MNEISQTFFLKMCDMASLINLPGTGMEMKESGVEISSREVRDGGLLFHGYRTRV